MREVDSPGVIKRPPPDTSHYPAHDLNAGPHQGWALVRYNYTAQQTDELSLVKGNSFLLCYNVIVYLNIFICLQNRNQSFGT